MGVGETDVVGVAVFFVVGVPGLEAGTAAFGVPDGGVAGGEEGVAELVTGGGWAATSADEVLPEAGVVAVVVETVAAPEPACSEALPDPADAPPEAMRKPTNPAIPIAATTPTATKRPVLRWGGVCPGTTFGGSWGTEADEAKPG